MLELLAPAGSMESLRAAVQNGADAVYLGCGSFNARQSAKNFTPQALTEAIKYCHIRGVAVHLAVNTLVSDRETAEASELIRYAAETGVDAFIVQDLGVVRLCRQIAPQVPVHGSTQLTVHSLAGVLLCAAWGMTRVVLSRELSREEIRYIAENSPIEIEVFVHGALCMCYSGQCYLSAAIGGRSGNRGRCAQPCRQSYGYGRWENRFPLSLKDNCLVKNLQELDQMGVASLKIEGRMKKPEYVATVTGVYRKALDEGAVTRPMMDDLYTAFNRQGFTDGYYRDMTGKAMFGVRQDTREDPKWLSTARASYEAAENPLVPVRFFCRVEPEGSSLTVTDPEGRSCTVFGPPAEEARSVALSDQALAERLSKTGGTPYRCAEAECIVAPNVTLSAAVINGMRRDILNQLTAMRARRNPTELHKPSRVPHITGPREHPGITVQVTTREQITRAVLDEAPEILYVPLHLIRKEPAYFANLARTQRIGIVLPRIIHDPEMNGVLAAVRDARANGIRDVLVSNIGQIIPMRECHMRLHGDFGLNLYNSIAMDVAKELELSTATLSFEMTLPQIRDVSKAVPCELLAYGRMPLMVTENCLIKGRTGECTCHLGSTKLVDKTGAEFPVIKDGGNCRSILLNGKKLNLLDRQEDLNRLGLWAIRLYFTTENSREVDQIMASSRNPAPFDPGACTRGLYLRGVE